MCQEVFAKKNQPILKCGISGTEILKRNGLNYQDLIKIDSEFDIGENLILSQIETEIKYSGYLEKQQKSILEMKKMENKALRPDLDYDKIESLRIEARQKLNAVKPLTLAQASRVSGVNPADIVVLMVYLQKGGKNG
jgi:tRNA uridine 5-carboxymethylaminomethyl modification enzyme